MNMNSLFNHHNGWRNIASNQIGTIGALGSGAHHLGIWWA